MEQTIEVEGLTQFSRALRKIDPEAAKGLRLVLNHAGGVVVTYALRRMPSRTGHAKSTVKARSTRTEVRVSEGSARYPYVPWLDFGGNVGRNNSVKRYFLADGRYLFPAVGPGPTRDEIITALEDGLVRVVSNAGLELD